MKRLSYAMLTLSSFMVGAQTPAPPPKPAPAPAAPVPAAPAPAAPAPAPAGAAKAVPPPPAPGGQAAHPQGLDWGKVGPMARRPASEAAVRKEVDAFVRQEDALAVRNDAEARLDRVDFPVYMVTDDLHGVPEARLTSREQYLAELKPFWDSMPKDPKITHKLAISVLSDALAVVIDDYTMTLGGKRVVARSSALVVKRAGQWKWKSMTEAGWGGMPSPEGAAASPASGSPPPAAPPPPHGAPPATHAPAPPPPPKR